MPLLNSPNHATDPIQVLGRVSSLASFGLFVIIALGYVDSRNSILEEIESQDLLLTTGSEQQSQVEEYRSRAESFTRALADIDRRAITESELAAVQDEILALAKQNGCMPKKASPRTMQLRDLPSTNAKQGQDIENGPKQGLLEIHEVGLALSIEGDLKHTLDFLNAIKQQSWYCSTSQLVLRRDPTRASQMTLEMDLRFSSLHPKQRDPMTAPPIAAPST
jgi:hypothetical protein